ncbi:MAG: phosphotransferase [Candidatus Omnitrophota bacterium]|nr:phosphotransferase [Candidatus Omnitrophota bacterium]
MLLEIHCHTSRYSRCSQIDPVTLVRQVKKKELQGVVITEHHYLWSDEELKALRVEAELDENFLILSGQEVETDIGHVLVFGASRTIEEELSLKDLRGMFPEAALVWAHPFRGGNVPDGKKLLNPMLDAIEIFSMNQTQKENYSGLKAWHNYKFTAVSGSDAHSEIMAGVYPSQFDHPILGINDIAMEIKKSRARPFFKEIPKSGSNIVVTEITIGTKGGDESRNRIILKNIMDDKKWESAKLSSDITAFLYRNGFGEGRFRVPGIIDVNEKERLIIEDGQRGKNLFDLLTHVDKSIGADYFALAARWLARFHNKAIKQGDTEGAIKKERRRFDSYLNSFTGINSPYLKKIQPVIDFVKAREEEIFLKKRGSFILNHGDYHPKNIIIGQDRQQDSTTLFISVIDFGNSIMFPRSFDVGYFLSQFQGQFHAYPEILRYCMEADFIDTYIKESDNIPEDFLEEVKLFKLRANLSIASYLIKVGKGQGPEMESLISRCAIK